MLTSGPSDREFRVQIRSPHIWTGMQCVVRSMTNSWDLKHSDWFRHARPRSNGASPPHRTGITHLILAARSPICGPQYPKPRSNLSHPVEIPWPRHRLLPSAKLAARNRALRRRHHLQHSRSAPAAPTYAWYRGKWRGGHREFVGGRLTSDYATVDTAHATRRHGGEARLPREIVAPRDDAPAKRDYRRARWTPAKHAGTPRWPNTPRNLDLPHDGSHFPHDSVSFSTRCGGCGWMGRRRPWFLYLGDEVGLGGSRLVGGSDPADTVSCCNGPRAQG
jgi:hypothetical protein